jgi:hypothetical protein
MPYWVSQSVGPAVDHIAEIVTAYQAGDLDAKAAWLELAEVYRRANGQYPSEEPRRLQSLGLKTRGLRRGSSGEKAPEGCRLQTSGLRQFWRDCLAIHPMACHRPPPSSSRLRTVERFMDFCNGQQHRAAAQAPDRAIVGRFPG